jgi:hypothetical protein
MSATTSNSHQNVNTDVRICIYLDDCLCDFEGRCVELFGCASTALESKHLYRLICRVGENFYAGMKWTDQGKVLWQSIMAAPKSTDVYILLESLQERLDIPISRKPSTLSRQKKLWITSHLFTQVRLPESDCPTLKIVRGQDCGRLLLHVSTILIFSSKTCRHSSGRRSARSEYLAEFGVNISFSPSDTTLEWLRMYMGYKTEANTPMKCLIPTSLVTERGVVARKADSPVEQCGMDGQGILLTMTETEIRPAADPVADVNNYDSYTVSRSPAAWLVNPLALGKAVVEVCASFVRDNIADPDTPLASLQTLFINQIGAIVVLMIVKHEFIVAADEYASDATVYGVDELQAQCEEVEKLLAPAENFRQCVLEAVCFANVAFERDSVGYYFPDDEFVDFLCHVFILLTSAVGGPQSTPTISSVRKHLAGAVPLEFPLYTMKSIRLRLTNYSCGIPYLAFRPQEVIRSCAPAENSDDILLDSPFQSILHVTCFETSKRWFDDLVKRVSYCYC